MTELAVAFAWAWGLRDWVTGDALGMSENAIRRMRRGMGLAKTGGGCRADPRAPTKDARSPARERALKGKTKEGDNVRSK